MTVTTSSTIAGPVDIVFQQTLLRDAKPRCPYFAGSLEGSVLASHRGTFTVTWRRYNNLTPTTSALSEITGTLTLPTRTATAASVTDQDATVSKYGDFIYLTEECDLQNFNNQTDGLVSVLGVQSGRSLNRLQRNILEDNATLIYASNASADSGVSDPIGLTLIRNANNVLSRNSAVRFTAQTTGSQNIGTAPIRPAYWGICHSDVEEDVRDLAGFISAEQYAGQTALAMGEFGTVGGVRFISSEDASVDASLGDTPGNTVRSTNGNDADLYTTVIFGMNAHGAISLDVDLIRRTYMAGDEIPGIILINKPKGSAGAGDPLDEIATLGWKAWHGGRLLNTGWIRGLRTAARKLS